MVGHVSVEVIVLHAVRLLDRQVAFKNGGVPLIGIATDEAEEVLEAEAGRPEIEGASLAGLPIGDVVVLAEPGGVPTILFEDLADGAAAFRHERVVAGIAGAHLGDNTSAGCVVVSPADERRAGWRAKGGSVKAVVTQTGLREFVKYGRGNGSAKGGRCAKADVIG